MANDHNGLFPDTEEALRALPGVGAYTAAAVAAIAFNRAANVVDGNVERVMSRLFAVEMPVPAARAQLRALSAQFVTEDRPGDWPQALMDLGSSLCRPRSPLCEACPLSFGCEAFLKGEPARYPVRLKKADRPHRQGHAYVLRDGCGQVALVLRPEKGLLGGMLGLPTSDWGENPKPAPPVKTQWQEVGSVHHIFTHFRLTLNVHLAEGSANGLIWMDEDTALKSLPTVFKKALERGLGSVGSLV